MAPEVNSTKHIKNLYWFLSNSFPPKKKRREHSQRHALKPPLPWYQNQTNTITGQCLWWTKMEKSLTKWAYNCFLNIYFIYLYIWLPGPQLQHAASSIFVLGPFSNGMWPLSCGTWHLVPWPGIKPWALVWLQACCLGHWTTREVLCL